MIVGLLGLLILGGVLLYFLRPARVMEPSPLPGRLQTTGEFTIPEGYTFVHLRVVGFCEDANHQMIESVLPTSSVQFSDATTGKWSAITAVPHGPCQVNIILHLLDNATGQPRNLILEPTSQKVLEP
jgi:hypothetical protein